MRVNAHLAIVPPIAYAAHSTRTKACGVRGRAAADAGSDGSLRYSGVDALERQTPKFMQPPSTSASGSSGRHFANVAMVESL
jgi:hypothetical protein